MTLSAIDLTVLVQRGRSQVYDWLPDDASVEAIAEILAAVANSAGGTLLIGIADSSITGVQDWPRICDRVLEAALSTDPPLIIPLPQIVTHDGATIVVTQIPSGMPHVYAYRGRYLYRDGQINITLEPQALRRLMIQRGDMHFETNAAEGAGLDDINWDKAAEYVRNLKGFADYDVQDVLLKRGCLIHTYDGLHPTNAGILLFGKDPQRFVTSSDISAVRFPGEGMGDMFSRQDITGTLPTQIKRAEAFLIDQLRKNIRLTERMEREEVYEYPLEAARELVVNAVAHRDYSIRGDNIRVLLFNNRMEVDSPGGLPGPMTLNNLRDERFSRNPVIVQVLADMHFIEKLGYGVDRVIDLMRQQNLQEPEFKERSGGFRVILHNDNGYAEAALRSDHRGSFLPRRPTKVMGHTINARQEAAIQLLQHSSNARITNSDLKELFPDVHPETIRRDLADLVSKEILVKMGEKRGSYYVLKDEGPGIEESS